MAGIVWVLSAPLETAGDLKVLAAVKVPLSSRALTRACPHLHAHTATRR